MSSTVIVASAGAWGYLIILGIVAVLAYAWGWQNGRDSVQRTLTGALTITGRRKGGVLPDYSARLHDIETTLGAFARSLDVLADRTSKLDGISDQLETIEERLNELG